MQREKYTTFLFKYFVPKKVESTLQPGEEKVYNDLYNYLIQAKTTHCKKQSISKVSVENCDQNRDI